MLVIVTSIILLGQMLVLLFWFILSYCDLFMMITTTQMAYWPALHHSPYPARSNFNFIQVFYFVNKKLRSINKFNKNIK